MELYIRIKDGQPFEHPILADNFCAAFPHIDVNNLPPEFARFERVAPPTLGAYEVYEGVRYERKGDGYADVHTVRAMTAEEKLAKQQEVKAQWALDGFASWTFDEESCSFQPPVPKPEDGKLYFWDEANLTWSEVPDA